MYSTIKNNFILFQCKLFFFFLINFVKFYYRLTAFYSPLVLELTLKKLSDLLKKKLIMAEEVVADRNDPELKYLSVERNQFNDPTTQAEWTQKRLIWVPHENQVFLKIKFSLKLCFFFNFNKSRKKKIVHILF